MSLPCVPYLPVSRQHIRDKQAVLSELQSQTSRLAQEQLPGLIQEMAALQVSTVLHGDYSLKIARQDYFTSKQDKVYTHLILLYIFIYPLFMYSLPFSSSSALHKKYSKYFWRGMPPDPMLGQCFPSTSRTSCMKPCSVGGTPA